MPGASAPGQAISSSSSPPPRPAPKPASGSRVLGIRSLQVAAPFEGRSFVYRTGEFSYDRDPYAEFMVPPADELVAPMCDWMRGTGLFSAVEETGSALKANTLVEIHVTQLYGDFRPGESATAVLTMRFEFFDAANGVRGQGHFAKGIYQQNTFERTDGERADGRLECGAGPDSGIGRNGLGHFDSDAVKR